MDDRRMGWQAALDYTDFPTEWYSLGRTPLRPRVGGKTEQMNRNMDSLITAKLSARMPVMAAVLEKTAKKTDKYVPSGNGIGFLDGMKYAFAGVDYASCNLTEWKSEPPMVTGWYIASNTYDRRFVRYLRKDGCWSRGLAVGGTKYTRANYARLKDFKSLTKIQWLRPATADDFGFELP